MSKYRWTQVVIFFLFWSTINAQSTDGIRKALRSNNEESALELLERIELSADKEIAELDKLLSETELISKFPIVESDVLFKIGSFHAENDQLDSGYGYFERCLKLNNEIYNREGSARSLYWMSRLKGRSGEFEEAKKLALRGVYLARSVNDVRFEYRIGNILSWSYFSTNHSFDIILEHEARQAQLANQLDDASAKAGIYNNFGYSQTISGLAPLDSIIRMVDFANDHYASEEGHDGRWYTLMNLTWLHRLKGDYIKSETIARKSFEQAKKIDDRHAIIETGFQCGESLLLQGKAKDAGAFYLEALNQRGDQNDRDAFVFDVYYARYLWTLNEREEAIGRLETAIEFLRTSEVFYEMHGRALLAEYYFKSGDIQKSKEQVEVFENPRSSYIAFDTRCLLACTKARILTREGQFARAITMLEAYRSQAENIGAVHLTTLIDGVLDDLQ